MAERPPNRQPSAASQRQSIDTRSSIRFSNPDIFSDDFALEPFEVADGYDASSANGMRPEPSSQPCTTPQRSVSTNTISEPISYTPRRNKDSQRLDRGGSFTLPQDHQTLQTLLRPLSVASVSEVSDVTSLPHRSLSTSSTFTMPRTQSPYQGATGPSHPYGMYPQGIGIARTPSVSTNSTIGMPERTYARVNGPAHPYGSYPQNTVPEGDVSPIAATNPSIPVGFPGLGQSYRRRLGPEGEEAADIIGPDGHTEQLPPYTRYPDGIVPKHVLPAPADTANVTPDPDVSQATLHPMQSRASAPQSILSEASGTRLNGAAAVAAGQTDDTGSFKERWTEKSKKRMCKGKLPVWLLVVVVVLLILLGALLGGIVGRIIGNRRGGKNAGQEAAQAIQTTAYVTRLLPFSTGTDFHDRPPTVTVTATSLVDATPLATPPTNLPQLPCGTFGVALGAPLEASNGCLTNASQTNAWGCGLGGFLGMQVTSQSNGGSQVQLLTGLSSGGPLRYGAQRPALNEPYNLMMMLDKAEPNRGPAFFFQQDYDKLVVVSESTMASGLSKRSVGDAVDLEERGYPAGGLQGEVAKPGDKPWFCFWNSTLLEGFIYINQNSSAANLNASSSSITSTPSSAPASTIRESSSPLSSNAPDAQKRQIPSSPLPPPLPLPYPKIVKIEEHRHANNAVEPYCQQMQVLYDGTVNSVPNPSGQPIIVSLSETEPIHQRAMKLSSANGKRRRWLEDSNKERLEKKDAMGGSCHCVWVSD